MHQNGGSRQPRILVVEDEMMVSMLIEDMLTDLGCEIVGPYVRVDAALRAAREMDIDAAVLDFNLNGENTYPVARMLRERQIPFVFATGYGASVLNESFMGIPLLQKPFRRDELRRALQRAFSPGWEAAH